MERGWDGDAANGSLGGKENVAKIDGYGVRFFLATRKTLIYETWKKMFIHHKLSKRKWAQRAELDNMETFETSSEVKMFLCFWSFDLSDSKQKIGKSCYCMASPQKRRSPFETNVQNGLRAIFVGLKL